MAQDMVIGAALDPEQPQRFTASALMSTNRFVNVAARTIAHFDPGDPSQNDYRPGTHTLLLWGRSTFVANGDGFQTLMFLLVHPLDGLLRADGSIDWQPQFFAGYDASGKPAWSARESDAVPVYGAEATVTRADDGSPAFDWPDPEFDRVNQISLSWVEPLRRWVMLYGGSEAAWLAFDAATNRVRTPSYVQPAPDAIHLRHAAHPWGRATRGAPAQQAWSEPLPVLGPTQIPHQLGCDAAEPADGCRMDTDPHRPLELLLAVIERTAIAESDHAAVTQSCLERSSGASLALPIQFSDTRGILYGAYLIDSWTTDVTSELSDLEPGERAVEIYWDVSLWNPYVVMLAKTQLRAVAGER
jgi:hypothetical protein